MEVTFSFDGELYEWSARDATWIFVDLPIEVADELRDLIPSRRGFGSIRVEVSCGSSRWRTSVFPDKASGSFVLPLKKAVRSAQGIGAGDTASFELSPVVD